MSVPKEEEVVSLQSRIQRTVDVRLGLRLVHAFRSCGMDSVALEELCQAFEADMPAEERPEEPLYTLGLLEAWEWEFLQRKSEGERLIGSEQGLSVKEVITIFKVIYDNLDIPVEAGKHRSVIAVRTAIKSGTIRGPVHNGEFLPLQPGRESIPPLLAEGWTAGVIGQRLSLTPNTLASYRKAIYRRWQVRSQEHLAAVMTLREING